MAEIGEVVRFKAPGRDIGRPMDRSYFTHGTVLAKFRSSAGENLVALEWPSGLGKGPSRIANIRFFVRREEDIMPPGHVI